MNKRKTFRLTTVPRINVFPNRRIAGEQVISDFLFTPRTLDTVSFIYVNANREVSNSDYNVFAARRLDGTNGASQANKTCFSFGPWRPLRHLVRVTFVYVKLLASLKQSPSSLSSSMVVFLALS